MACLGRKTRDGGCNWSWERRRETAEPGNRETGLRGGERLTKKHSGIPASMFILRNSWRCQLSIRPRESGECIFNSTCIKAVQVTEQLTIVGNHQHNSYAPKVTLGSARAPRCGTSNRVIDPVTFEAKTSGGMVLSKSFLTRGLPFLCLMIGGSFALTINSDVRYMISRQRGTGVSTEETRDSLWNNFHSVHVHLD